MQSGYIAIETHSERPGVIRLRTSTYAPDPASTAHSHSRLRYIARFNDREAALMHMHEILKRRLVDLDEHLYRVSLEHAVAAAESLDLKHRRIHLDIGLSADSHATIDALTEKFRAQRRAWAAFFQTLGYIGVGLVLLNLLASVR